MRHASMYGFNRKLRIVQTRNSFKLKRKYENWDTKRNGKTYVLRIRPLLSRYTF